MGFDITALLPALLGGAGAAAPAAADAAAAAPLDILAGGAAAGTALPGAIGSIAAPTGALASGLATDPTLASSAVGTFAPGLDTSAAGLGVAPAAGISGGGSLSPSTTSPAGTAGGAVGAAASQGGLGAVGGGAISPVSPVSGGGSFPGGGAGLSPVAPVGDPIDFASVGPGAGNTAPTLGSAGDAADPGDFAAPGTTGSPLSAVSSFYNSNSGLINLGALGGLSVAGQLLGPKIANALGENNPANTPEGANLTNVANQAATAGAGQNAYGTTLEQPLVTGQLPPGQQQSVTNALNDAIATIKAKYASLGLSGSSMEAEAVANAQNQSVGLQASIEQQMATTGAQAISAATSDLGLQESVYSTLMNAMVAQDQQLSNAISGFANAVGGGLAAGSALAAAQRLKTAQPTAAAA